MYLFDVFNVTTVERLEEIKSNINDTISFGIEEIVDLVMEKNHPVGAEKAIDILSTLPPGRADGAIREITLRYKELAGKSIEALEKRGHEPALIEIAEIGLRIEPAAPAALEALRRVSPELAIEPLRVLGSTNVNGEFGVNGNIVSSAMLALRDIFVATKSPKAAEAMSFIREARGREVGQIEFIWNNVSPLSPAI